MRAAALLLAAAFAAVPADAARRARGEIVEEGGEVFQTETELIDVPTAGALDYGSFSARTRFYSAGSVLNQVQFGLFQRVNLGASLDVDQLIGQQGPVRLRRPQILAKYRFTDGSVRMPAMAVGYDGQGLFYDRARKEYIEKERGLYVVGSKEVLLRGLVAHGGVNINDFDRNNVFGFVGLSLNLDDKASLVTEWDNVNKVEESRWNTGIRINATPFFTLDFAVREMGRASRVGGVKVEAERVVQMRYTGSF